MTESPGATTLIAGVRPDACLGYANTLFWRGREARVETLSGFADLLRWVGGNAGLDQVGVESWQGWSQQHEAGATRLFAEAIAVREAIYRIFSALASGSPVPEPDLAALNRAMAEAPGRKGLAPVGGGYAWCIRPGGFSAPALLAPVLWSAADLMTKAEPRRVRQCANEKCLWLFIDESKNGTRRWCDMTSCGNRAKARRHYLKRKKV